MTRKAKESICGSISAEQKRGGDSPPNSRDEKFGNYGQSSTKYSQLKIFSKCEYLFRKVELFFFNTGISFSQGKFLLADCEVLAYAHEPWKLRFL